MIKFCYRTFYAVIVLINAAALHAATFTYSYDSLNRITNAAYSDGSAEKYSYDPSGNRRSRITGLFDSIAPTVPAGLTFSTNANRQILLSWNSSQDVGTGVAAYQIYLNGIFYTNSIVTNFAMVFIFISHKVA